MLIVNTSELISYLGAFPLTYRSKTEIIKAVIDEVCNYYSDNNYRPIEDDPVNYAVARVDLYNRIRLTGVELKERDKMLDDIIEEIHRMVGYISEQLYNYFVTLPVAGRLFPQQIASSHVITFVDNETLADTEEDERHGEIQHLQLRHYEEVAAKFKEFLAEEDLERLIPIPKEAADLFDEFVSEMSYTLGRG